MKIVIASDHAGFEMKQHLIHFLNRKGYEVNDIGTHSIDSVDYPDYAHALAKEIEAGNEPLGVLLCGTGNGVCMTANKHKNIRAALAWNAEIAALARLHNNANVLCLPARFISTDHAEQILDIFLNTEFEGGRHEIRVEKI